MIEVHAWCEIVPEAVTSYSPFSATTTPTGSLVTLTIAAISSQCSWGNQPDLDSFLNSAFAAESSALYVEDDCSTSETAAQSEALYWVTRASHRVEVGASRSTVKVGGVPSAEAEVTTTVRVRR